MKNSKFKRPILTFDFLLFNYSVRNDFTGFANAAFIAWKLTVISVIASAPSPEAMKIHNDIVVL